MSSAMQPYLRRWAAADDAATVAAAVEAATAPLAVWCCTFFSLIKNHPLY